MKKRFVCAAMLSLMLMACGEDSTTDSLGGNRLGLGGGKSVMFGTCLGSPYDDFIESRVLAKDAEEVTQGELPKAYIVRDSAGNEQVMILKVSDYCVDEIGTWIDFRTDCLGFRFSVSYENDFKRVDGSTYEHDWNFGFFVYLRALGPSSGNPFHGD